MSVWGKPMVIGSPYGIAVGQPAVFTSRGGALGGLTVQITPDQSGSGDPSPTNIRPIMGWAGSLLTNGGTSIYDPTANPIEQGNISSSTGQNTSTNQDTRIRINGYIPVTGGASYGINCNVFRGYFHFYKADRSFLSGQSVGWYEFPVKLTVPADAAYMRINMSFSSGNIRPGDVRRLEIIQDADVFNWSSFGSVAGGALDVINGTFVPEYCYVRLTGSESWTTVVDGSSTPYFRTSVSNVSGTNAATFPRGCSHYPNASISTSSSDIGYMPYHNPAYLAFRPDLTDIPTLSAWQTYLSNQLNAGTPVTCYFCIQSSSRPTISLTPLQLQALVGANSLYADCGLITVKYPRDGMIYIA